MPVRWSAPPLDPHIKTRVNRRSVAERQYIGEKKERQCGGRVATGLAAFRDPGMPGIQKQ